MLKNEGHEVAVVIPIYKARLTENEMLSLTQCVNILGRYSIIFICYQGLDTSIYQQLCSTNIAFVKELFDKDYFQDIHGYNQLMLSPKFYRRFLKYKYILIYQLDAYVFKDELSSWCSKGFDFIGAPQKTHPNKPNEIQFLRGYARWLNKYNRLFNTSHAIKNVGNGGLSLRRTKACYYLVKLLKSNVKAWGNLNEDGFFKYWGNVLSPLFKLPDDDIALRFSIETEPQEAFVKLHGELPFGCHAFEKYEPEFWQRYIPGLQIKEA